MHSMSEDGMNFCKGIWGTKPETGSGRDKRGAARIRRLRLLLGLGAIAGFFSAGPAMAADLSACRTTISKPGFYRVTQDLTASGGDCLDVNAPRTIIFLNGHHITGNG